MMPDSRATFSRKEPDIRLWPVRTLRLFVQTCPYSAAKLQISIELRKRFCSFLGVICYFVEETIRLPLCDCRARGWSGCEYLLPDGCEHHGAPDPEAHFLSIAQNGKAP